MKILLLAVLFPLQLFGFKVGDCLTQYLPGSPCYNRYYQVTDIMTTYVTLKQTHSDICHGKRIIDTGFSFNITYDRLLTLNITLTDIKKCK